MRDMGALAMVMVALSCSPTDKQCAADDDCSPGLLCLDGTCVGGCRSNRLLCAPGEGCPDYSGSPFCLRGCVTGACEFGHRCDPIFKVCVGCLEDADCKNPPNLRCTNGACLWGCPTADPLCFGCLEHTDCDAGLFCFLAAPATGGHSYVNQCTSCVAFRGTYPDPCASGSWCSDAGACEPGCKTAADCDGGACVDHACR